MKVGTLLAHLGKSSSTRSFVVIRTPDSDIDFEIEKIWVRKDGTVVIRTKGG